MAHPDGQRVSLDRNRDVLLIRGRADRGAAVAFTLRTQYGRRIEPSAVGPAELSARHSSATRMIAMTVKQAPVHAERAPSTKQLMKHAWIDRDVSWLQFNLRVLNEAFDVRNPLLERLKFLGIFSSNLDEFYDVTDIFAVIRAGDVLVHHPYESFDLSVEQFIQDAANDPQTLAIKMTVYRVGDDTPFVRSLIRAAEGGKQVACVIELQARFDEARNIHWAKELEKVGAHVTYGVLGLKIHTKVALVVRKEGRQLRCYAHIGTGNYHVKTARLYTDVGLLTCNPAVTTDVVALFHHLTGRSTNPRFEKLLVAPFNMRDRFRTMIEREIEHHLAGRPARIIAKMNQVEDVELSLALVTASQAGVPIDLIVRGSCCLCPRVAGYTENVRVRSIIGRFLEHSRIFYFANGQADPVEGEFYLGSADWMYRNLSRRVEAATPVDDRIARLQLWEILETSLMDCRQAWELESDGEYVQRQPDDDDVGPAKVGVHAWLMDATRHRTP